MRRICYYALGGGNGHAMRGMAVLDRLRSRAPGVETTLLAPARFAPWAARLRLRLRSPPDEPPARGQLATWVAETVVGQRADLLLVDVFARGLLGELGAVPDTVPAWLIGRRVKPAYYLAASVRSAIERRYRRLIWAEAPPPDLARLAIDQHRVAPVLIQRPSDCLARDEARASLGLPADATVVLAIGSGNPQRQARLCRLIARACVNASRRIGRPILALFLSNQIAERDHPPLSIRCLFPAMRQLRAADLVVAGGGYHSVHEIDALGLAAVFIPQTRRYDDQFHRVAGRPVATGPEELEDAISQKLLAAPVASPARTGDGAATIAAMITAEICPPPD